MSFPLVGIVICPETGIVLMTIHDVFVMTLGNNVMTNVAVDAVTSLVQV
jgi:hypothetical protein